MINSFELTDKCPQAIKIIWWNEHFEIPHLQIIATQQMLTPLEWDQSENAHYVLTTVEK